MEIGDCGTSTQKNRMERAGVLFDLMNVNGYVIISLRFIWCSIIKRNNNNKYVSTFAEQTNGASELIQKVRRVPHRRISSGIRAECAAPIAFDSMQRYARTKVLVEHIGQMYWEQIKCWKQYVNALMAVGMAVAVVLSATAHNLTMPTYYCALQVWKWVLE